MEYRLVAAQVEAAGGDRAAAERDLRALLGEVESRNWSDLAAQARESLAQLRAAR